MNEEKTTSKKPRLEHDAIECNGLPDIGQSMKTRYVSEFQEDDRDLHCIDVSKHLEALFSGQVARTVPSILKYMSDRELEDVWINVPFVTTTKGTSTCFQDTLNFVSSSNLRFIFFCQLFGICRNEMVGMSHEI